MNELKEKAKKNIVVIVGISFLVIFAGLIIANGVRADEVQLDQELELVVPLEVAEETDPCAILKLKAQEDRGFLENIKADLEALSCKVWGPDGEATAETPAEEVQQAS